MRLTIRTPISTKATALQAKKTWGQALRDEIIFGWLTQAGRFAIPA